VSFPPSNLRALEPDEKEIAHAALQILKPCPFCGGSTVLCDFVNDEPLFGKGPVYRSIVTCTRSECGATTSANMRSREEAQDAAIRRWQRRTE
jgi:hypothetical protein